MLGEVIDYAITMSPFVAGYVGIKYVDRVADRRHMKAIAPVVVDGRTQNEWYDIIKGIGPEATEELMLGPLKSTEKDGEIILDRDEQYAWHPRKVMGQRLWANLEREWYPNEFCTFCDTRNCKGKCAQKRQHDREMEMEKERQEIEAARRKQISDRKAKMIETKQKMERDFYDTYSKAIKNNKTADAKPQFTTVKNLGSNTSGYRITFRGIEHRLSVQEMKDFQAAFGLLPSGLMDRAAADYITICLKQGVPLKPQKIDGITFSVRQVRAGVVKLIAKRDDLVVSQEVLLESFGPLYRSMQAALRKSLGKTEEQIAIEKKAKVYSGTTIGELKAFMKASKNDLRRIRKDLGYDEWMDHQW